MLSTDAKKMIFVLYGEYKNRRNHGISKNDSKEFQSPESIQESFFPLWSIDDVDSAMRELDKNGYLQVVYASGTINDCCITDEAIAKLENQPKETFLNIADFISKFIP